LRDGSATEVNASRVGTTKRVRIQIDPRGNTVPDSEVGVDFSLNKNSSLAMNNPTRAHAVRRSGTPTTRSIFTVDIPGSKDLRRCEWFHYRWAFRYQLPGETGFRGFYASQVKTFQILASASSEQGQLEEHCPPVP